jgi:hypothetical protein
MSQEMPKIKTGNEQRLVKKKMQLAKNFPIQKMQRKRNKTHPGLKGIRTKLW